MKYDVAVIGGGPAGMMAAGRAGEMGSRVVLIEKNNNLGVKLLCTGHGRCNITNVSSDWQEMIKKYGQNGKFLFSAFHKFGPEEMINWLMVRGIKTKVEDYGRVFPVSNQARDVLNCLIDYLKNNQVKIKTKTAVKDFIKTRNNIKKAVLDNGEEIVADKFIIAVGGKSYPATGSSGDGYFWLNKIGHTIIPPAPIISPVILSEKFIGELEGASLTDVKITAYRDNRKIIKEEGGAVFTHDGMSGPIIFALSRNLCREKSGKIHLAIDFAPTFDFLQFDRKLQRVFSRESKKSVKNILSEIIPPKIVPVIIGLSKINPLKPANLITREERKRLVHLLKEFKLTVAGFAGFDVAMATAGGVDLKEVDPKTMRSKIIDNLYFAGEILDLDGPTGGYNLQAAWSTGYAAGEAASR